MTESLSLSFSALLFACLIDWVQRGRLVALAAASLTIGIHVAIRPTGIGFIPALLTAAYLISSPSRSGFLKISTAAIVPMVVMIGAEWAYYKAHHSGPRQSLAPIHIIGKASLVNTPGALSEISSAPEYMQTLMEDMQFRLAPVRHVLADSPDEPVRCGLLVLYEIIIQYDYFWYGPAFAATREHPDEIMSIGKDRLKRNIPGYLRNSADHLLCLWTMHALTASEQRALHDLLQKNDDLPFWTKIKSHAARNRLPPAPLLVRWSMLTLALLLFGSALVLVIVRARGRNPSAPLIIAGLSGIAIHVSLMLIALVGVGASRYIFGLWVPLALGALFSCIWLWNAVSASEGIAHSIQTRASRRLPGRE